MFGYSHHMDLLSLDSLQGVTCNILADVETIWLLLLEVVLKDGAHLRSSAVEKHPLIDFGYSKKAAGFY
jgi:hypothetical protein